MDNILDYRAYTGSRPEKFFKATLFDSGRLLLGLNCLEPGQTQSAHEHSEQDKFYFVLEGQGDFTVGDEERKVSPGFVVLAPAGVAHGVANRGQVRLVLLVGIAPSN